MVLRVLKVLTVRVLKVQRVLNAVTRKIRASSTFSTS